MLQYYKVPVYEESSDKFLSENQLTEQLLLILKDSGNNEQVGILTTEHRDTLAIAYENLTEGNFCCQITNLLNFRSRKLISYIPQIQWIMHQLKQSQNHCLLCVWIKRFQSPIQMMISTWPVRNWFTAVDPNKIPAIVGSIRRCSLLWTAMESMASIMNIPRRKANQSQC